MERSLAALARAAAVRVAEQEHTASVSKDVHTMDAPLLDNRLAEGAEVEMEVLPMGANNHEISTAVRSTLALVVDEAMLEKVLGVINSYFLTGQYVLALRFRLGGNVCLFGTHDLQ